jgi:hypothetical protein
MSSLTILGDTSGSVILAAPAIAGSGTLTLPTTGGTILSSGNQQGFSAWLNGNQSITANSYVRVNWDQVEYNNGNAYSTSTYRFTPVIAGYYQFNIKCYQAAGGTTGLNVYLYKNNSAITFSQCLTSTYQDVMQSKTIYSPAAGEYYEVYVYSISATGSINGSPTNSWFQAMLIRTA